MADLFTTKLLLQVARLKAGDPSDDTTVVGPLIDPAATQRVEAWVEEAVAQGARVLLGGKRLGTVLEATVLTNVKPDMKVSCQEVFGPVVTVTRYRQLDEAITELNQSAYGLQAGVFTQDINKIFRAFRLLEVGAVLANAANLDAINGDVFVFDATTLTSQLGLTDALTASPVSADRPG